MAVNWHERITIDPDMHGGRPTVRGMRITVQDVLDYLGSGMSVADTLRDFRELEYEDIQACLAYAAETLREHATV